MIQVDGKSTRVAIRQPMLLRVYVVGYLVFWTGTITWTTVLRNHGSAVAIGLLFILFGIAIGYRMLQLGVHSGPDGTLTIRNSLGRRRLTRAEIEDFRFGTNGGRLGMQSIHVLLRDGTVYRIDVTNTALGLGRKRNTASMGSLKAWLHDSD